MTVEFDGLKKVCARLSVIGMVAFGATACSSIPDWVDPTTWIGGSTPSDTETAPGETPNLAAIPDRPVPTSTSDEQQQVTQSLAADRSRTQYSAESLRGGTEPAAAPPPPASQVAANDVVVPQNSPPTSPAPAPDTTNASSQSADTGTVDAAAQTAPPPPPPPTASELPPAEPAMASNSQPAVPPPPAMATNVSPSDAALGFRPSTAPPLDPSVGQFVPQPIIARYNQTASAAGTSPRMAAMAEPTVKMRSTGNRHAAVGGPEAMSGAVVANLEALQAPSTNQAAVYSSAQGLPPAAVVLFPGDGSLLNADGRTQVRAAVEAFKQAGGQGYIRVVGHASSRTSNMPVEKHLEVIFSKSQDRANAVAKELIREGVPANRVLVEAVGDSQPVYYESMPKGEDGNRRAEIFLQS